MLAVVSVRVARGRSIEGGDNHEIQRRAIRNGVARAGQSVDAVWFARLCTDGRAVSRQQRIAAAKSGVLAGWGCGRRGLRGAAMRCSAFDLVVLVTVCQFAALCLCFAILTIGG